MFRPRLSRALSHRLGGVAFAIAAIVCLGFVLRIALVVTSFQQFSDIAHILYASAWGVLFDLEYALYAAIPLVLYIAVVPQKIFRQRWHRYILSAGFALFLGAALFFSVAEWLFWEEFGIRFNFIAVDYLVYTTEVTENILESYPIALLLSAIALASVAGTIAVHRTRLYQHWLSGETGFGSRLLVAGFFMVLPVTATLAFDGRSGPEMDNRYEHELARNGLYLFFSAFRNNELPYKDFYLSRDSGAARSRALELIDEPASRPAGEKAPNSLRRLIVNDGPELRPNVIQITVESLSADFLGTFGNDAGLTPHLDELAAQGMVFTNMMATGTRTVRGMESLTLSIPPTPGRSMVKRPNNANLFTIGSVFQKKDYKTAFFYGGYGYFDQMNSFFEGNGFEVHDRGTESDENVDFTNAWGVSDEDLYEWVLADADLAYQRGTPFYDFVMTTSNHRPYSFPDGRIDLPSLTSGRNGAVKYTDHAIHEFIEAARKRPWFDNTVFVIVADHCASSAGKTELPIENYRIPLIVYAPGLIHPQVVDRLSSQIDYAPTLFGLLNWTYDSEFFGHDVLADADAPGRALIGTYQSLGLLEEDTLVVLKPMQQTETFCYDRSTRTQRHCATNAPLLEDAIAYYQTASEMLDRRLQLASR